MTKRDREGELSKNENKKGWKYSATLWLLRFSTFQSNRAASGMKLNKPEARMHTIEGDTHSRQQWAMAVGKFVSRCNPVLENWQQNLTKLKFVKTEKGLFWWRVRPWTANRTTKSKTIYWILGVRTVENVVCSLIRSFRCDCANCEYEDYVTQSEMGLSYLHAHLLYFFFLSCAYWFCCMLCGAFVCYGWHTIK